MKTSILLLIIFALAGCQTEPDLTDQHPLTKYEKCMVLYGDTNKELHCTKFKEIIKGWE